MQDEAPKVGEVRCRTLLGTTATYRVVAVDGARVVVEVIDAPGLVVGHRMAFTADSVRAMERVPSAQSAARKR